MYAISHTASQYELRAEPSVWRHSLLQDMALMLGRQFPVYTAARRSAAAARLGMPLGDYQALEILVELQALPTGQLANLLGLSPGGITALLNRLETAGYVQRGRDPLDRRMIVVAPVMERCQALFNPHTDLVRQIEQLAQDCDTEQLHATHQLLRDCLQKLRRDAPSLPGTSPPANAMR